MSGTDESSAPTAPDPELSTNTLFRLLRDSRRRDALRYLLDRRDGVPLEELSAAIASRGDAPSDQRLARVSIDLHHVHLPKMAEAGVVRYDPGSEFVEPLAMPGNVAAILDCFAAEEE